MTSPEGQKNYENCMYYVDKEGPTVAGYNPFRYDTELVGGKFCLPSAAALEDIGKEVVE